MKRVLIVAVADVVNDGPPNPLATPASCDDCGTKVWMSPSSIARIEEYDEADVLCPMCSVDMSADEEISADPDMQELLDKYGGTVAVVALAVEQWQAMHR